mgnify:CR=1 FL=1
MYACGIFIHILEELQSRTKQASDDSKMAIFFVPKLDESLSIRHHDTIATKGVNSLKNI